MRRSNSSSPIKSRISPIASGPSDKANNSKASTSSSGGGLGDGCGAGEEIADCRKESSKGEAVSMVKGKGSLISNEEVPELSDLAGDGGFDTVTGISMNELSWTGNLELGGNKVDRDISAGDGDGDSSRCSIIGGIVEGAVVVVDRKGISSLAEIPMKLSVSSTKGWESKRISRLFGFL